MPWFLSVVCCLNCGNRWVAVYEGCPEKFQCEECGEMEGVRD